MACELRKNVVTYAESMERKLRANDHKGGWLGCKKDWLADRLVEEAVELFIAAGLDDRDIVSLFLKHSQRLIVTPTSFRVRGEDVAGEAADVGNFAMMLRDVVDAAVAGVSAGEAFLLDVEAIAKAGAPLTAEAAERLAELAGFDVSMIDISKLTEHTSMAGAFVLRLANMARERASGGSR